MAYEHEHHDTIVHEEGGGYGAGLIAGILIVILVIAVVVWGFGFGGFTTSNNSHGTTINPPSIQVPAPSAGGS